jgi:transcriptional regulator with XRE-family HTH domain
MDFGEYLKDVRRKRGVSQRKLAHAVGINFTYLSKIENGHMAPPSEGVLLELARVLEMDKDEVMVAAGKVPSDVVEMLKDVRLLKHVRKLAADSGEE